MGNYEAENALGAVDHCYRWTGLYVIRANMVCLTGGNAVTDSSLHPSWYLTLRMNPFRP